MFEVTWSDKIIKQFIFSYFVLSKGCHNDEDNTAKKMVGFKNPPNAIDPPYRDREHLISNNGSLKFWKLLRNSDKGQNF